MLFKKYILIGFVALLSGQHLVVNASDNKVNSIVLKKKKKKKKTSSASKSSSSKEEKIEDNQNFVVDFDNPDKQETGKAEEKTITIKTLGVKLPESAYRPLVDELEKWLGTPYKYAGNSMKGIDCSGLVHYTFQNVYKVVTNRRSSDLFLQCNKIEEKEIQFGDLVFFKISGNSISHVGIYLAERKFIHASTQSGVIVSHLDEAYYKKYFYAFGRLKLLTTSNNATN